MKQGQPIRDASHLYEVERRVQHAARPGFRIMELQLSPTQKVPWHSHELCRNLGDGADQAAWLSVGVTISMPLENLTPAITFGK